MQRRIVLLALAMSFATGVAAAAQDSLIVPLDTVVRAPAGSSTVLAEIAVDSDLVGLECTIEASAINQSSVHPGNDIVVSTGTSSVTLRDVEGEPSKSTTADGTVILGPAITLTLIMGPDGVFSAGASVQFTCAPPTTTTTSTTSTTTTSTTTTTTTSTTTTATTVPTSVAPTTATTVPTTTTMPTTTTTTRPEVQVLPAQAEAQQLPATGIGVIGVLAGSLGLLTMGLAVRGWTGPRGRHAASRR